MEELKLNQEETQKNNKIIIIKKKKDINSKKFDIQAKEQVVN